MIDRILYNSDIVTQNESAPHVSALAISYGRVVASGHDDAILALASINTVKENLQGRIVVPGMIDAHIHWAWTSHAMQEVNVFEVQSKSLVVDRVWERVSSLTPGEWIVGFGWSQAYWEDSSFPTAADLDPVSPHNPVCLRAKSGHAVWVNSEALRIAGVTENMRDPEGGQIGRDTDGKPTGILFESAIDLITYHIPASSPQQIANEMKYAQNLALASGLTGLHDFDGVDCLRALQILRDQGDLHLRVVKNINYKRIRHVHELCLQWGFGDDWIRLGGLKIFSDGALGPRTALMIDHYNGEPDNYGIRVTDKEVMLELVSKASELGIPSTIHAIGDLANREVLDVYAEVRRQEMTRGVMPSMRRHRIEHVQVLHPDDVHRLAELNIIASMQPIHATSDYEMADKYWGDRSQFAYNPRIQLDQGVCVAFGSDSPIDPFEPLRGIHAAVTRRRPDGSPNEDGWRPASKLTVEEALRAYTIGPAYAVGMEDRLGKLAPGYLADLVVLDRDIFTIPPDELLETQIVGTMVDGVWRNGGV